MIRATYDSNVWISGIFWVGEGIKLIRLAQKGSVQVFVSQEILLEIASVLQRERKFQLLLKERNNGVKQVLERIISISTMVHIKEKVSVIKEDPDDDKILECAVNSSSSYILTYDNHLLRVGQYKGISILHPTEFLKEMPKL